MNSKKPMLFFLSLMILIMTMVVSGMGTLMNFGFASGFFLHWMKAWAVSYITALPVALIIAPVIRSFVLRKVQ
ncbi:MAG: DUF2798 domain-containing protein [Bacteroidales bacterium]|jgi:hypothetical protein|nr:DUF2798 domain-containing protein [Bacteroidales bacterium]HPE99311.1 DUF2798 domain-containing protein [Bacteroidales bacterium]